MIEGGHPLRVDENLEHCRLAIVASTLSNLDSFSRLMRKKYLTPSHLKLTNLTPSRIISPRLLSPHLIMPHLTSSHLIITLFPWSHLTLCHLTLSYVTISHVVTSNPTSPHLILKLAPEIHHPIYQKWWILCIEKFYHAYTDLSTKTGWPMYHHSLINFHRPAKKHAQYILISPGCIQSVIRIQKKLWESQEFDLQVEA